MKRLICTSAAAMSVLLLRLLRKPNTADHDVMSGFICIGGMTCMRAWMSLQPPPLQIGRYQIPLGGAHIAMPAIVCELLGVAEL